MADCKATKSMKKSDEALLTVELHAISTHATQIYEDIRVLDMSLFAPNGSD